MKKITINQLRKHINVEMSYESIEKIQVTYCCPSFMGGYKKEDTETFEVDVNKVVKAVSERGSKIALGKIYTAYTEGDFRRTLFVDIVEL